MTLFRRGSKGVIWRYDFHHKGKRYQGSTHETEKLRAKAVEDDIKQGLGKNTAYVRAETAEPGLYFLRSPLTGLVKVGCSGNLTRRIDSYKTNSSEPLELLAKIPAVEYQHAEREIHEFLRPFREQGEWFRITGRHIEAALGYWITGHPAFGQNKKIIGKIADELDGEDQPDLAEEPASLEIS